jgi:hypothetical protein
MTAATREEIPEGAGGFSVCVRTHFGIMLRYANRREQQPSGC